ncbi:RDD family protein [Pedobacter jejuensis]|uniref:RDD family protein n=1 Tax=Pedobacter jejuensis TaxID=1268550 RepID=A0A3N0BLM7_9SPHI|nr:RDD family protein [Pedobacter jejuensis]RNL49659.1 RDD family protein [Pedobacter jejuensis]
MESIRISTAQNVDIDYEVAGLGERIAARLIDLAGFLVLYIVAIILMIIASISRSEVLAITLLVIFFVIFIFYDLVCELTMDGQTFGKKIMKIKVISLDGGQPTFGQYLMRWIFRIVDFGVIFGWGVVALISVAISKNHQRVGDMLAKTTLIKTVPRTKIDNVAFSFSLPEDYQPIFKEVVHLNDRDAELIYEVLTGFYQTGNPDLIYAMFAKTKNHIAATLPEGMNELQFLETVMKDYKHLTANS